VKGIKSALALGLMASAAIAAPAGADVVGCGGEWSGSDQSCAFAYGGGSLTLRMSLSAGALGELRLETGEGADTRIIATCEALLGPCVTYVGSDGDFFPLGTTLRCVAAGPLGSAGRYGCTSGE